MPKLTIAIPAYNRKEFLGETITSLLVQSFTDYEIVIFDNASDYDVEAFLAEFNDQRIRLVRNEKNLGNLQNFINIFAEHFESDYLMVFHDDDTMHPKLLETEVMMLDSDENLAWVNCPVNFVKDHHKMFDFVASDGLSTKVNGNDLTRWLSLSRVNLSFDGAMYRVKYLVGLREYAERFFKWCDRPFMIDIARGHEVAIIHDKLVNYRLHPGQDSQTESSDTQMYIFELQKFYRGKFTQPLSKTDAGIFYRSSTAAMIISGLSFSSSFAEYFSFIGKAVREGLFKWQYIDFRGAYYFAKVCKFYLRKLIKHGK